MNRFERIIVSLSTKGLLSYLPDELYLPVIFHGCTGKRLNLKNPVTFNEKLQWLKLRDRKKIYNTLVDKNLAKEYVSNLIGSQYVIPTINAYKTFNEIDFEKLPDQFVIKCSHDSGSTVVCTDKKSLDIKKLKKKISQRMRRNFYWNGREWAYKDLKPSIIVEQYIDNKSNENVPNEYQFWCFNGKPQFVSVIFQPHGKNLKATYDMEWKLLPFVTSEPRYQEEISCPDEFEKMKSFAILLAEQTTFVRVDFMVCNNKIYFGELTLCPASGFIHWKPEDYDIKLGKLLDISEI